MDAAQPPRRLGRGDLIAYALPGLPLAALTFPVYLLVAPYYAQTLGLSLTAIGLALMVSRIADAFADPLIGILSDATRTRFGRRRPWVLLGTPFVVIATWMLFVPPEGAGIGHLVLWSVALTLSWTAILVPYSAWGAELSEDYHQRSAIAGAREVLVVVGTLVAAAMPALVQAVTGDASPGVGLMGLALFVALALPLTALIAMRAPDPKPEGGPSVRWSEGLRVLAGNAPFRRLLVAYFVNAFANGLPAALFILFVGHVIDRPETAPGLIFLYFLCGMIGVPLWMWVARRTSKHFSWIAAMLWACAIFALVPFTIGEGDVIAFAIVCVLTGLSLGADLTLPASMQADVVDIDTAETGQRRAGLYFALWGLATQLALAAAAGVAYPALDLAGFDATLVFNAPDSLLALALLYAGLPVVLKLIAIAMMWTYPIDAAEHAAIRARIAARA